MMDWFVRAFLRASMIWLALGVSLGVAMTAAPGMIIYRPAHMHMLLLGFVAMMIFGVAYHVIPRFVGRPLRSRPAAAAHWWAANAGLALMSTGFFLRPHGAALAQPLLIGGGVLAALGAYAFAINVWTTLGAVKPESGAAGRQARSSPLPLASPPADR